jgi:ATP-dependent Clp protease adaptor protein ClpS
MPRKKSNNYRIIVMNDSKNTFLHVQQCLQEICGHNHYQAIQCSHIIHQQGECQVYSNKQDQCMFIYDELLQNGLKVKLVK